MISKVVNNVASEVGWQGKFEIFVNNKLEKVIYNKVTDNVIDQLIETLRGTAPDMQIKYLALGTNNTAVTGLETQLGTEIFRTPITTQSKVGVGELLTEFIVLDVEAVATIEEIGIFGGTTATASANSGTLVSRILWHKVKTSSEEITIRRTDKIIRA